MSHLDLFKEIKLSFGNLWQTKLRGNTFEIITPYATTNNRFISVFLTQAGDEFIISDGGWIHSRIYDVRPNEEGGFLKILFHYQNAFQVLEVESKDGLVYYYVKASSRIDVASKIFDLALFVQTIVSVCQIEFEDKVEKETRELFVSKANEFIRSVVSVDRVKFNSPIDPNRKEIKFNAIYYKTPNDLILINYITGSSVSYFSNSIFRTNTLYEMAEETAYNSYINKKVSLLDTAAAGFVPKKISQYLNHLERHSEANIIPWDQRERLYTALQ